MSAEKEIVNFWYNKKGLFTLNNIKTSSNRDCGILALKFDKVNEWNNNIKTGKIRSNLDTITLGKILKSR